MADDEKELKDQRVVTMMSPSELEAIDNWMFANRIRSRGEAIRRLCQAGLAVNAEKNLFGDELIDLLENAAELLPRDGHRLELTRNAESFEALVAKIVIWARRALIVGSKIDALSEGASFEEAMATSNEWASSFPDLSPSDLEELTRTAEGTALKTPDE